MSDETTRLRALLDGIALPLSSAQTDSTAIEIDDAEGTYVGSVDVDHGPGLDASESTETHAALIVAAVNALPVLLDAAEKADALLDSAGRRIANLYAERNAARVERDDLAAVLETRTAEHALAMERVRELEAIIAGRTTPPTDAEIYAHDARDGAWLVTLPPRAQGRMLTETRYITDPADVSRLWWSEGAWWVPVLRGRPCAWPTAEVSR